MSEDSLLGQQLDEYRLEALLGRGGMARVYRGLDLGLNRYVAIKVIDTPHRSDGEYVKRFKIEAQAIARLDHSHVVHLYRYGEVGGMLYMAMQFIEGADLGYLLESYRLDEEFISVQDAVRLTGEICQALDYIHAHGIIHRDVKPSNIMLTHDEGRAILTDFGLALRAEVGTRGEVFGSPHYIAPEQAVSSAHAVPQSDLYALGVIVYEMFTGVLPFNAKEPLDVAMLHMSSPPPPPREIRPELSPEVEAVLLKALEKKPGDRYQSGRALALALERAVRRQQAQLPPARRSIPERVTVGLAANPLPPIPAVVTPPKEPAAQAAAAEVNERLTVPPLADNQSVPATIQFLNPEMPRQPAHSEPAASAPVRQETTSNRWPLWAAAALVSLCIVGCLAVTVLTVVLRSKEMLAAAQATAASPAANIGKATLTSPPKTNTLPAPKSPAEAQVTSTPTATASPQPVAEADEFFLTFWRCDDEGCLVVANDGDHPFPMGRLQIKAKKLTFSGGEWGIEWLEPGQCVTAVKNEDWVRRMPEDIDCTLVGSPIVREGRERFWEGDFTVIFEDQKAAECRKKSERCEMEIER